MNTTKKMILAAAVALAVSHVQAAEPTFYSSWESSDLQTAWKSGYKGQGATITVVDDYSNRTKYIGMLTNQIEMKGHGFWTSQEASLVAPAANVVQTSWMNGQAVKLAPTGLNVINASYGMFALAKYAPPAWNVTEQSIINYAKNGQAVVVKAAGNDHVAVGQATSVGTKDFLASSLIGSQSAIFAGALDKNGTTASKANIASYSNVAGNDPTVQRQFLMVGVKSTSTNLAGTSFAAPIISGYAAVVGSKFTNANATQITNQLLNTARTDTINGYNVAIHGRGEASLSRALAPVAIK